jgi:adenylate cyclase
VATVSADVVTGTVAFTDIVGFTTFTAEEGDDRALDVLSTQASVLESVLPSEARLVKELGDGLMLWFPDASSAIHVALELQSALVADASTADGFPLWLRMGLHAGEQRCRGADLIGHDVNVAARIVDLAGPGEVLASQATVDAAGEGLADLDVVEVGPVVVKGIPDPVWIHRVERSA